jgi:Lrp/AsnC family leucine-responsive transcriptional regulator
VVIEPSAMGRAVTAFIAARGQSQLDAKRKKAFDVILKSDEIVEAHTVAGDDCFFIKVRTDSINSLNTLVSKLTAPPLSLSTRTTIVMQTHCEKIGGITLGEP